MNDLMNFAVEAHGVAFDLPRRFDVLEQSNNRSGGCFHHGRDSSSVLLFARVMGEKYAGTPLAKYFVSNPENVPEEVHAVRRRQP